MGKKGKRGVNKLSKREFNRKTNIIALILLIYIVIMLISTSKILDRLGKEEIERSITGEVSGVVRLIILAPTNDTNLTVETTAVPAVVGDVLTSGGFLKSSHSGFKIDLYHKESKIENVQFTNMLDKTITYDIANTLSQFVSTKPTKITLESGETVDIQVIFYGNKPGVYSGVIILKSTGLKSIIPFVLDVSSKEISGKVNINIPEQFLEVIAGDNLFVNVDMTGFIPGEAEVVFKIIGSENEEIMKISQFMNIKHSLKFDKTIELPDNLPDGVYILAVEVRMGGLSLVDSQIFTVGKAKSPFIEKPGVLDEKNYFISMEHFRILILGIVILIVAAFVLYAHEIRWMKKGKY